MTNKADLFKFIGFLAFLVLIGIVFVLIWPHLKGIMEPGGLNDLIQEIRSAGPIGFLVLFGLQFLQIVVFVIPGEVVQIAAGMMFGPWLGLLLIIVGCFVASAFIYFLVHLLGAPFVQSIVDDKYLQKLDDFEESGRLALVVGLLFLIPGFPKDVLTYIVPLTNMNPLRYLVVSNLARIPGVTMTVFAADSLIAGDYLTAGIVFGIALVILVLCWVMKPRLMDLIQKIAQKKTVADGELEGEE